MKIRAPQNRTLTCTEGEINKFSKSFLQLAGSADIKSITNAIVNQDFAKTTDHLPSKFVDLLVLDPPYNLTKNYNGHKFREKQGGDYVVWFADMVSSLKRLLVPNASIYVCSDWKTSSLIFPVLEEHFHVRNRITWERDKGRGAKSNWKNNTEDIWFCTCTDKYYFNVDAVKLKRRVIAPYRQNDGSPKDWQESNSGNYRLTHPSNIWSDITIPFWSMTENTDHPTQKPEKLIAKLILASSCPGDFVLDPFLGSGTTAVVAKKLNRRFCGIELNREYCCWAAKRLNSIEKDPSIQGYENGVFWERNSLGDQKAVKASKNGNHTALSLFND